MNLNAFADRSLRGLGAAPATNRPPAWVDMDKVWYFGVAKLREHQRDDVLYTLEFSNESQEAQIPLLFAAIQTLRSVLNMPRESVARMLLMMRSMSEYADKNRIPDDQVAAFDLALKIKWKYGGDWSPFIKKNKSIEIGAVAAAVVNKKFAGFQGQLNEYLNKSKRWYGDAVQVYGTTAVFNTDLMEKTKTVFVVPPDNFTLRMSLAYAGSIRTDSRTLNRTRLYLPFTYTGQFAAIVAAVNTVMGFPAGNRKNIGTATSDVLKLLRFVEKTAPTSGLGRFVSKHFNFGASDYKNLRAVDATALGALVAQKGNVETVSTKIMTMITQFQPTWAEQHGSRYASASPAPAPAPAPAPSPTRTSPTRTPAPAVSAASNKVFPSAAANVLNVPAKPAVPTKNTAGAKLLISSTALGVRPTTAAKVGAIQAKNTIGALRVTTLASVSTLVGVKTQQTAQLAAAQQTVAVAEAQAQTATTPEAQAQAAQVVEQAQAQVAQAQAAVNTTEAQLATAQQALAQVDAAAATANQAVATATAAAQSDAPAAAANPSAPPAPEVGAAAESASADAVEALAAATAAVAEVLPPEEIAAAASSAAASTEDAARKEAAATGDPAPVKALEAVKDSGVIKDAVKEGVAIANEAAQGNTSALLIVGGLAALLFFAARK